MNSKNIKTFDPNRLLLRLAQKISLKRNDKFAALSNTRYQLIYICIYIYIYIHSTYIYIISIIYIYIYIYNDKVSSNLVK